MSTSRCEAVGSFGWFSTCGEARVGSRSVGTVRVDNQRALEQAIAVTPGAAIQEFVSGPDLEYTAGVVCDDGECRALIVVRRDLKDGNTVRAYVDDYSDLGGQIRVVAEKLKPDGPANLQFRSDRGVAKVFEINARFSGTTPLRALAGLNEVEMVLRRVLFGEPVVQPSIEPMVILRHLSDTVVRPDELVAEH